MNGNGRIAVEFRRVGEDADLLRTESKAFADIRFDYSGTPKEQRETIASRLLCASALYSFASSFSAALADRGARINSLTGRALAERGHDDYHRQKITRINIELEVSVEEEDLPVLETCEKIMEHGCLVTYSVDEGIEVEHSIRRKTV